MRVCSEPGCPALVPRAGRCPAHQRGSPVQRGFNAEWRATRRAFLRANPSCVKCGARATDVDHIAGLGPLGPGGHDFAALQALCHACHSRKTVTENGGFGR